MKFNLIKQTLIACSLSVTFFTVSPSLYANEVKTTISPSQIAKKFATISLTQLDISEHNPTFNKDFPLAFIDRHGYVPLKQLIIQPKGRNPFTFEHVMQGYFLVNNWKINQNNLNFLKKVSGAKISDASLELYDEVAKLAYLAENKQAMLGEFYSVMLLDELIKNNPKAGKERVNSPINKAREYFEKQNKSRQNSDKESADKLHNFYRVALNALPLELQSDLTVQYYFKSILFQDFETQQVTETLLSNHHSPEEIGQINASADIIVSSMRKAKFAVQVNENYQPKTQKDLGPVNTNFVGEYGRSLLPHEKQLADADIVATTGIKIEVDKEKVNHYKVTMLGINQEPYKTFSAQLHINGRGLDSINGYITFTENNTLRIYYSPDDPGARAITAGHYHDFTLGTKFKGQSFAFIPKPTISTPLMLAKDIEDRLHPKYPALIWIHTLKGHGDMEQDEFNFTAQDYQTMSINKLSYEMQTFKDKRCNNDLCVSPTFTLEVNKKDLDDLDDNTKPNLTFPLNHGLTGKLYFHAIEKELFYLVTTDIPYGKNKITISVQNKGSYYEPKESKKAFIDGVNFLNEYIAVMSNNNIDYKDIRNQIKEYRKNIN